MMMMITTIILLSICGLILYLIIQTQNTRVRRTEQPPAKSGVDGDLIIENVKAGGVIQLTGIGSEMEDMDVVIKHRHIYRQGGFEWWELEGETGKDVIYIEIEDDDELIILVTLKKLKLRDINLTKDDLKRIDDTEDGELTYEGETYYYEDSDSATFIKNSDSSQSETFYYWMFENESGNKIVSVERWSDASYEVSYGEIIKPWQVTVFSLGG